jgi:uncharacterized membrane protein YvbJ
MQEPSKFCSSCGHQNHIGAACCHRCQALFVDVENIRFKDGVPDEKFQGKLEVTVIDIRMPFWSMVNFMVKWAIAAIPALIILSVIFMGLLMMAGVGSGLR